MIVFSESSPEKQIHSANSSNSPDKDQKYERSLSHDINKYQSYSPRINNNSNPNSALNSYNSPVSNTELLDQRTPNQKSTFKQKMPILELNVIEERQVEEGLNSQRIIIIEEKSRNKKSKLQNENNEEEGIFNFKTIEEEDHINSNKDSAKDKNESSKLSKGASGELEKVEKVERAEERPNDIKLSRIDKPEVQNEKEVFDSVLNKVWSNKKSSKFNFKRLSRKRKWSN